jgi:hypothetical protein
MFALSPLRTYTVFGSILASLVACGGATPPAQDATDHPAVAELQGAGAPAPAKDPAADPAATPPSTTAPTPPATAAIDSSGDIKPAGDDPWLAAHQMPVSDTMKTMKSASAKVQGCWKAGLARDPSTSGEVKIRMVVNNDGNVRAWRDDGSSMSDEDVTKCVGAVVEKLKFPKQKSPGDAWGVYSIHFGG